MNLSDVYSAFNNLGLLAHLNEQEKSKLQAIAKEDNITANSFFYDIPRIATLFDSEDFWATDLYEELVNDLIGISRNILQIKNLSVQNVENDSEKLLLSFEIDNQMFTKMLIVDGDWIDHTIFTFVNNSLSKTKITERFYQVFTNDQVIITIFLTQQQFSFLSDIFEEELIEFS